MRQMLRPLLLTFALTAPLPGQSLQYTSPSGVKYYAQKDTGPIARAEAAHKLDPKNIDKIIALGVAQSGARQFREAIETFTSGLAIAPPNTPQQAMLLRWRGHRYLSTRQMDKALADLTRGNAIDTTNYGIWYHLGIVHFARGEFDAAASCFARAQPKAPDAGEYAGSTDWLWMSLMRAGKSQEAAALLEREPDSLPVDNAYTRRLKLYRGKITPEELFRPADTADVQVATLAYGLGNWYLVHGDTARARTEFNRSIKSGGWPGFGFIMSEVDLRRTIKVKDGP